MLALQRSAGNAAAGVFAQAVLARRLKVEDPKKDIPTNKTNKLKQSNAETVRAYLDRLCQDGGAQVDLKSGEITLANAICTNQAQGTTTPVGCSCLCHMIASRNKWKIRITDSAWPYTRAKDHHKAVDPNSKGTGGTVTAPSPNSTRLFGTATASGGTLDTDPWLVLGHELCGHAWLEDQGKGGPDEVPKRGKGGHQETVKRENEIRQEHGIEARGLFDDPHCGESYIRENGEFKWSEFHDVCIAYRLAQYGEKYKIGDKIPVAKQ